TLLAGPREAFLVQRIDQLFYGAQLLLEADSHLILLELTGSLQLLQPSLGRCELGCRTIMLRPEASDFRPGLRDLNLRFRQQVLQLFEPGDLLVDLLDLKGSQ